MRKFELPPCLERKQLGLGPLPGMTQHAATKGKGSVWGVLLVTAIFTSSSARAQVPSIPPDAAIDEPGPPRLRTPALPSKRWSAPNPTLKLPPVRPSPRNEGQLSSGIKVFVREITLTGNTAFTDKALGRVTAPFENRSITAEELQELRHRLTLHYVNRGYINSGAVIPDQQVTDGIIRLQIVEGRLNKINVAGNEGLRDEYLKHRIALAPGMPMNIKEIQENLQILQQNPLLTRINAELGPGARPGEGVLNLRVAEERPYDLGFVAANDRPPSVGAEKAEIYVAHRNLTGGADTLGFSYAITDGADDIAGFYTRPLNAMDTALGLSAARSDSTVIEEPFKDIDIDSELQSYEMAINHPFYVTPQRTLTIGLSLERRHSETFLLGRPFSFSPGEQDGESDVTALRFSQAWLDRILDQVIAARSTFSLGIDALGATVNGGAVADGQYLAWLGQFQWVRRFDERGDQLVLRSDLQLSEDPLLPVEQFAVGGIYTVRGYRENELVRDNGFVASAEVRIPTVRLPIPGVSQDEEDGMVQLAPFADFGWAGNTDQLTPDPETIASVGLGLLWDPSPTLHGELYWGYGLRDIDNLDEDMQDSGIHFRVEVL